MNRLIALLFEIEKPKKSKFEQRCGFLGNTEFLGCVNQHLFRPLRFKKMTLHIKPKESVSMVEPVTTIAASTIAALAFQKFIESGAGELAKKFTGTAIVKMDELRQKIWNKLRGKSNKVDEALTKVEQGDREALATIAKNLDVVMDEDPGFATEVQVIAREINAGKLLDQSSMNQYNFDQARGFQTKVEGGTAYVGEQHFYERFPKADG